MTKSIYPRVAVFGPTHLFKKSMDGEDNECMLIIYDTRTKEKSYVLLNDRIFNKEWLCKSVKCVFTAIAEKSENMTISFLKDSVNMIFSMPGVRGVCFDFPTYPCLSDMPLFEDDVLRGEDSTLHGISKKVETIEKAKDIKTDVAAAKKTAEFGDKLDAISAQLAYILQRLNYSGQSDPKPSPPSVLNQSAIPRHVECVVTGVKCGSYNFELKDAEVVLQPPSTSYPDVLAWKVSAWVPNVNITAEPIKIVLSISWKMNMEESHINDSPLLALDPEEKICLYPACITAEIRDNGEKFYVGGVRREHSFVLARRIDGHVGIRTTFRPHQLCVCDEPPYDIGCPFIPKENRSIPWGLYLVSVVQSEFGVAVDFDLMGSDTDNGCKSSRQSCYPSSLRITNRPEKNRSDRPEKS